MAKKKKSAKEKSNSAIVVLKKITICKFTYN